MFHNKYWYFLGLLSNETLRILKMGKNPIQTAGAYGVVTVLRQNSGTAMELVNFADVVVGFVVPAYFHSKT